jgi:hypothetical protein
VLGLAGLARRSPLDEKIIERADHTSFSLGLWNDVISGAHRLNAFAAMLHGQLMSGTIPY